MKKFEYHVHETEFKPGTEMIFTHYLSEYGRSSWELVLIQPLQTITNDIVSPGRPSVRLTFLCVFKRRKSWRQNIMKFLEQKKFQLKQKSKNRFPGRFQSEKL